MRVSVDETSHSLLADAKVWTTDDDKELVPLPKEERIDPHDHCFYDAFLSTSSGTPSGVVSACTTNDHTTRTTTPQLDGILQVNSTWFVIRPIARLLAEAQQRRLAPTKFSERSLHPVDPEDVIAQQIEQKVRRMEDPTRTLASLVVYRLRTSEHDEYGSGSVVSDALPQHDVFKRYVIMCCVALLCLSIC
jgi:hypothetical protein